jgi:SAM-dependent methyltransferase
MSVNATDIPERFIWATEMLNISPSDNILEIGCGAGLFAEQIAGKLTTGKLMAIDRSSPMLEKAKKRNRKFIDNGRSEFIASDFLSSGLPNSYFNKVVAFNVNFFWKEPAVELEKIKDTLATKGFLYVLYDSPFKIDISAADPIVHKLVENLFDILDVQLKKLQPSSAFCIISKPW